MFEGLQDDLMDLRSYEKVDDGALAAAAAAKCSCCCCKFCCCSCISL